MPAETVGQAQRVFANLKAALASTGLDLGEIVTCNVYLVDMVDFGAMNGVYAQFIDPPDPARRTLQVAALPAGARFEIEAVAAARKDETP